jgi:hypothetical protein
MPWSGEMLIRDENIWKKDIRDKDLVPLVCYSNPL